MGKISKIIKPAGMRIRFAIHLLPALLICCICLSNPCVASPNMSDAARDIDRGMGAKNPVDESLPDIDVNDSVVRGGLLYDVTSKRVVWEKQMHRAYPIASLTKMMVALLVVEDIHEGKLRWDTPIRVTRKAARERGSSVNLRAGYTVTVRNLLKAALISSGNDAAYLLAQYDGGSAAAFVRRMNRRAATLGMSSTHYSNPTGLPCRRRADDNHASPADLLRLSLELLKYPELLDITGTSRACITQSSRRIQLRNHNSLVSVFDEVDGLKTGFTRHARFCLVATSNKDNRRLIAIALGVSKRLERNRFVENLFNKYYGALGMAALSPKTKPSISRTAESENPPVYKSRDASGSGVLLVRHRIKRGETLYSISRAHGCTVAQLKRWNRLRGNRIRAGRQLKIYRQSAVHGQMVAADTRPSADHDSQPSVIYYKVRPGDTLWHIKQKFDGITVKKLMRINRIRRARDLKAGTVIKIVLDV